MSFAPFPQFDVQIVGLFPEQRYPAAGPVHELAHPIPSFDPSSHPSLEAIFASPQVEIHEEGVPEQVNPNSIVKQEPEHPSPDREFESSQDSGITMIPSPQTMVHTEGNPEQLQPDSVVQDELQPSPDVTPPSSHCSESLMPFPQF